ncbi:4'-phosphopantetheinyl transferase family protein [Streptomyces sp. Qhu_M48]|uniref:4'-phosphopantetheinyl transferase family protein n=1 Tax=Streptomyces sp. Qhu_M48 TaxID=3435889 RepID=UPI003F50BA17
MTSGPGAGGDAAGPGAASDTDVPGPGAASDTDAAGPGAAVVVVATTREVLDHPELHEDLLAPWERRRLSGIRLPSRRDDVVASRLLVRLCAALYTGLPPAGAAPAQLCPDCGRDGHGRPYLPGRPGVGVSLSHADGLVAAAVGPGAIGVDVEPSTRRPGPLRVLRRLLPETALAEATAQPDPGRALLRLWVRREALLKAGRADFTGRADGLLGQDGLHLLEWTDRGRGAVAAVAGTAPAKVLPVSASGQARVLPVSVSGQARVLPVSASGPAKVLPVSASTAAAPRRGGASR